jgi:hypothetical protein
MEKFKPHERERYPEAAARSARKPVAALSAVLDAKPQALGFVLPEPFIDGAHYRALRERIEGLYKNIEVVALPDKVFRASVIRSSLVIAQELRVHGEDATQLRSTVVAVRDRDRFLKTGAVSEVRSKVRAFPGGGTLWIDELEEVWEALAPLPKLGSMADVHRGIEWKDSQSQALRKVPEEGFCPGIHSADAVHAFSHDTPLYLDCRPERLRGGAFGLPWGAPKILANAARVSRGPWCFAAAVDATGLVGSQQLFGIWPRVGTPLDVFCALLNSPLAVAYVASHSPPDRIRVNTVTAIPLPSRLPNELSELVQQYVDVLNDRDRLFSDLTERANRALYQIDAAVLGAYDLSPRLERRILEYFRGEQRPTLHEWVHWLPADFVPFIPLKEYISGDYQLATGNWLKDVVHPWPEDEAEAIREILS